MSPLSPRTLGPDGLVVSPLGVGCLPMSGGYGGADETESLAAFDRAIELGVTLFDTAAMYGWGHNEQLVGRALVGRRDRIVLATKFGRVRGEDGSKRLDGRPESVAPSLEASLERLGVDHVDLYYLHRVDPSVPIEETVGAMGELVRAGKVRHLGLCEVTGQTIERAVATFPITALQSEWSLWARELEEDVLSTARRCGVGIVPFCPLGRGFLTGTILADDLGARDARRSQERLHGEFLAHNLGVLAEVRKLADEAEMSPAQLAIAWLLAQGDDVVPIPGVHRVDHLEEDVRAAEIPLDPRLVARLEAVIAPGVWSGSIFPGGRPTRVYGSTPALTAI